MTTTANAAIVDDVPVRDQFDDDKETPAMTAGFTGSEVLAPIEHSARENTVQYSAFNHKCSVT
jgi:hypothetical protein